MGRSGRLKVGISGGDFNGVGMEILIEIFKDSRIIESFTPIVYSQKQVFDYYLKLAKAGELPYQYIKDASDSSSKKINVVNCWDGEINVNPGVPDLRAGEMAYRALKMAVDDLIAAKFDVLVTGPIDKNTIQSDDFKFKGHTDYLANVANVTNPLMILCSDELRVGLVTDHIPLKEVAAAITEEKVLHKIKDFEKSLKQDFLINRPKIAVMGLNPHAGDNGVIGKEDMAIISKAVNKAAEEKILAFGPFGADGFFGSGAFNSFDGVLAMYHDQGLAPFKALAFDSGVNFTAGLPIVRTSPGHGTAYELAGTGKASVSSFRNAMFLALDIYNNRIEYREMNQNPLKINSNQ